MSPFKGLFALYLIKRIKNEQTCFKLVLLYLSVKVNIRSHLFTKGNYSSGIFTAENNKEKQKKKNKEKKKKIDNK